MITGHFTLSEKPRGSDSNQLSPLLMQEFYTVSDLEKFLSYNHAYIVELNFTGSLNFNQDLEVN